MTDHSEHQDLKPFVDNTYSLGSLLRRWKDVYATTFHGDGSLLTGISTSESDPLSLHLDQTTPQNITGGQPDFNAGLRAGSTDQLSVDASGNVLTTGTLGAGAITGTSFIIGANTLNTTEWAFLDGQDQSVFTTSTPQFANLKITAGGDIRPSVDSTTAINIAQADGTDFVTFDTTNMRVGIGTTSPTQKLDIEKGHIRLGQVTYPTAPTVAVNATAGNLNGNYYYRITFVTALGETEAGVRSAVVAPATQQVDLTNIPVSSDSAVTSRKIYRTTAGGYESQMKFVY